MTRKTYTKKIWKKKPRVQRIRKLTKFFDNSPCLLDKQLGNKCYICGGTHENKYKCKWKNKEDFAVSVLLLIKKSFYNKCIDD